MKNAEDPPGFFLTGQDLYEMAKQRGSWDIEKRPRRMQLQNPQDWRKPVRDEDLDAPLDEIIEGLETQVSEFLGHEYSVTAIKSPETKGERNWATYELALRSEDGLLDYTARPASGERPSIPDELKYIDLEITMKGPGIGSRILESAPYNGRLDEYKCADSVARAQWTVPKIDLEPK